MADHPTDFLTLARTAEAWHTDPARVLAWLGLDTIGLVQASPPALAEVGRRLHDLRTVAQTLRAHGFVPSWKRCTQDPLPGMGGATIAALVAEGHTAQVVAAVEATGAGVFA